MDAKTEALQALIDTINATGGLTYYQSALLVPVADEDWTALASAYVLACKALGCPLKVDGEDVNPDDFVELP